MLTTSDFPMYKHSPNFASQRLSLVVPGSPKSMKFSLLISSHWASPQLFRYHSCFPLVRLAWVIPRKTRCPKIDTLPVNHFVRKSVPNRQTFGESVPNRQTLWRIGTESTNTLANRYRIDKSLANRYRIDERLANRYRFPDKVVYWVASVYEWALHFRMIFYIPLYIFHHFIRLCNLFCVSPDFLSFSSTPWFLPHSLHIFQNPSANRILISVE